MVNRRKPTQNLLDLHDAGVGADAVDSRRLLVVLLLVKDIVEGQVGLGELW